MTTDGQIPIEKHHRSLHRCDDLMKTFDTLLAQEMKDEITRKVY